MRTKARKDPLVFNQVGDKPMHLITKNHVIHQRSISQTVTHNNDVSEQIWIPKVFLWFLFAIVRPVSRAMTHFLERVPLGKGEYPQARFSDGDFPHSFFKETQPLYQALGK